MNRVNRALAVVGLSFFSAMTLPVGSVLALSVATSAVAVSDTQVSTLESACVDGPTSAACVGAVQGLVNELTALNPGSALEAIIRSIAAKSGYMSNAAVNGGRAIDGAALGAAITALADLALANGLATVASAVGALAQNVTNGVTVDVTEVSRPQSDGGGGSPLFDHSASSS